MAVSYRIVIFLLALLIFAGVFATLNQALGHMEGLIVMQLDSPEANRFYKQLSQLWSFSPFFVFVAGIAWLIKQSVVVNQ